MDNAETLTMPNAVHLRTLVRELLGSQEDMPLTRREIRTVGWMIAEEMRTDTGLLTAAHMDFESWALPRFTVLISWLAPHGLLSQYPKTVLRVARYLLGETTEQEEANVNWERIRNKFPKMED